MHRYFAAAARLRRVYGINRLVVATDDASAAAMCAAGVMGFECSSMAIERGRFDARQSIERRVVRGQRMHSHLPLCAFSVHLRPSDLHVLPGARAHICACTFFVLQVHHPMGVLSGSAVALDTLADVEILSECDAHVLVLRSAVSRLAYALSTARKGRYAPLISLQWPWGGLPGPH